MGLNAENFNIKKWITPLKLVGGILLIASILHGCSNQDSPINHIQMENAALNQDIDLLVKENKLDLSISQLDGVFVPANTLFSQRIISLLSLHGDKVSRVASVDNYDLILKFEGYKDIHLNLDLQSFWFAGSDHLYTIPEFIDLAGQWNRYMIRYENGKLMYDSFERTIVGKSVITDENKIENNVTLFYDGDIRLSVNKAQMVIDPFVAEDSLNTYSMRLLGKHPLIAVINRFAAMKGPGVKLNLLTYTDQKIQSVFSSNEMGCTINNIALDTGTVTLGLPFAKTTISYPLTKQERVQSQEIASELKASEVSITDDYMRSIAGNVSCSPLDIAIADVDKDGNEELLLLTKIYTMGAKTPVSFNINAVFTFILMDNAITYKEVSFESDQNHEIAPFSYFQPLQ